MKRAWILLHDGTLEELGPELVDDERIRWPQPGMPTRSPTEQVDFAADDEFYCRHEIIEGTAYVFVRESEAIPDAPTEVADRIRRLIQQ